MGNPRDKADRRRSQVDQEAPLPNSSALLQDIARHLEAQTTVTPEQLRDPMKKTDVRRLTNRMEELAAPAIRLRRPRVLTAIPARKLPPTEENSAELVAIDCVSRCISGRH
jgi:hypothetical protein